MAESDRTECHVTAGRVSNEELCTWLAADAAGDARSCQLLLQAAAPLLLAYFEGQSRGRPMDLEVLTLETLVDLYRRRTEYDTGQPFRAWLLHLARGRLAEHLDRQRARPALAPSPVVDPTPAAERETVHRLRRLARQHVESLVEEREQRRTA